MSFTPNPMFLPEVEKAVIKALDDLGDDIKRDAASEIRAFSSSAARAVRKERAKRGFGGPSVTVAIGKGLGTIFEFSKQQNRRLKGRGKYPAGTTRGVMPRHEFFNKTVERHIAKGLPLGRYLF